MDKDTELELNSLYQNKQSKYIFFTNVKDQLIFTNAFLSLFLILLNCSDIII
jgi:hypothetical protein